MKYTAEHFPAMILALVPACINIGILVFGILRLPRSKTTVVFLYLIFSLTCWQFTDVFLRLSGNVETARFWLKVFAIGIFAAAPLSLQFTAQYVGNRFLKSSAGLVVIYLPFAYFFILLIALPQPTVFEYHPFWGFINIPRSGTSESAGLIAIPFTIIM